jgi:hypothetical protein
MSGSAKSDALLCDATTPKLVLTWDDGPSGELAFRILEARGSVDAGVELYWCGANLLRPEIRAELGIAYLRDVPRTRDGQPVSWLAWLDERRRRAERVAFMTTAIDPAVRDVCRKLCAYSRVAPLDDLIGYHGITHDPPDKPSHPVSLTRRALVDELIFFELLIQAAFEAPDYRLRKGRPPYGAGLRFRFQTRGRMYESAYPRLAAAGERFSPGFTWAAWEADTQDYTFGSCEEGEVVSAARDAARRSGLRTVRILLHERYAAGSRTLSRLFAEVAAQQHDGVPIERCGPCGAYRIEPGPRWSMERLSAVLARQPVDASTCGGVRVGNVAREFLRDHTPFEFEPWLAASPSATRVRLESFDGISFISTVIAMAAARSVDDLVRHVRSFNEPLNDDASVITRDRMGAILARMQRSGFLCDATQEISSAAGATGLLQRLDMYGATIDAKSHSRLYFPTMHVRGIEPWLHDGDVLLTVLTWPASDRPCGLGHCAIVSRERPDAPPYWVHASDSPLGRPHGRRAGVSLATRWMPDRGALRDDEEWCTVAAFLEDNTDRWLGITVLRPAFR